MQVGDKFRMKERKDGMKERNDGNEREHWGGGRKMDKWFVRMRKGKKEEVGRT